MGYVYINNKYQKLQDKCCLKSIFNLEDNDILEILLGDVNDTIKKLDTDTWSPMMYHIAKHIYPMYYKSSFTY
jgi:hypothetical protein